MAFYMEKQGTTSTLYVLIDEAKNYMRLEGRSFNEEGFFKEISDWLDGYLASDFKIFTFDCELDYINSSTVKLLYNMLLDMDKHATAEKKIIVNWHVADDNEIMIECGKDFREEMSNLTFKLLVKKEK